MKNLTTLIIGCFLSATLPLFSQAPWSVPHEITDQVFAHPAARLRDKPQLATSPQGYTPTQVRHAYGFDQVSGNGAGQTIAIIDAYGSATIQNDLNTFSSRFGLAQTQVKIYYPQGQPTKTDSGWALETSLDVEWAHAVAPGANIILVIAKTASTTNLLAAVDYAVALGAKQISMSWGGSEYRSQTLSDHHFNKAGVSFFASAGDNGSGVLWPGSSPYVVSVGGTTLKLDASGNVLSETGWSGSGGGISKYESRPDYQLGWQTSLERAVPDVSYNADPSTGFPVFIGNYNKSAGWIAVGGTSAGAPQWAALMALVNASRKTSLGNTNNDLYFEASAGYTLYFKDVTTGSNGKYNAGVKYDEVTGLGTPLSANLVPVLSMK